MDDSSSSTALIVRSEDGGGGGTRRKQEFSEDELVEIFKRLPAKSLMRFRCLSKNWYNLILSPDFIALHYTHTLHRNNNNKNEPVTTLRIDSIAQTTTQTELTLRFGDENPVEEVAFDHCPVEVYGHGRYVKIVGCANGVVCLSLSPKPQTYALLNPATRQVRVITDCPLTRFGKVGFGFSSGFCFDPVANCFKVIQIEFEKKDDEGEENMAEIHVFSTATNAWTQKNLTVPYPIGIDGFTIPTCLNGYLHWHEVTFGPDFVVRSFYSDHITINGEDTEDMYILRYDIINEAFERIEMPSPRNISAQYVLAPYRGSPALFVHTRTASDSPTSGVINVWVLNDYTGGSSPSWSKIITCEPSSIEVASVDSIFRADGSDSLFFNSQPNHSFYARDPVNGETKKDWEKGFAVKFSYCQSLVTLN